jgi:hypothetical protein
MSLRPDEYFSQGEHLLADSAYKNSSYVVSSFKRPRQVIPKLHTFNYYYCVYWFFI